MVVQMLADPVHVAHHRDAEFAATDRPARARTAAAIAASRRPRRRRRSRPAPGRSCGRPACWYSTPTARPPSNRMRVACALVATVKFCAAARRAEIGARRAPAPPVAGRRLVIADTLLAGAVEIVVGRDAGLDRGLDHRVAERRAHRVRHVQRPAGAVELVGAALLVLRLLEERQHRIPVPALAAALAPAVVIGRGAAHVDHAVDRAGAAQHLAARLVEGAAVELLLRLALEHPVHLRVGEGLGVAERNVDPRVGVARRRLRAAARGTCRTSLSRPATAQPADPAPVTMKS